MNSSHELAFIYVIAFIINLYLILLIWIQISLNQLARGEGEKSAYWERIYARLASPRLFFFFSCTEAHCIRIFYIYLLAAIYILHMIFYTEMTWQRKRIDRESVPDRRARLYSESSHPSHSHPQPILSTSLACSPLFFFQLKFISPVTSYVYTSVRSTKYKFITNLVL